MIGIGQENQLVANTAFVLPRVNLLPPEIAEKRAFRKVQIGLGLAVLGSVGVVALLYTAASGGISRAEEQLAAANSQSATLNAQSARFRAVTAVYARAQAAQLQLGSAMGDEVRYSQLLNDLSLTVPENMWLTSLGYTQASGSTAPTAGSVAPAAGIGTFTVEATAFSHDDVAVWLESIAGLKTYANPYFSRSEESLTGTRTVVKFTSTATLTDAAQSHRYSKAGG